MRKHLHVADLGDLLEQPLNGVLATYLSRGEVLWRFNRRSTQFSSEQGSFLIPRFTITLANDLKKARGYPATASFVISRAGALQ